MRAASDTTPMALMLSSVRQPAFDASLEDGPLSHHTSTETIGTPFGGKLLWVGNATCVIEYEDIRFMTDPNFLHQGKFNLWYGLHHVLILGRK